METTANFDLSCLSDTDPAAVALQMQDMALKIDEALTGQQASLNAFLAAPTAIATTTANQTTAAGTTVVTGFALTFANYTIPANPLGFTLATDGTLMFPDVSTPVWYHIGAYLKCTAVGAITANSIRAAELFATSATYDPTQFVNFQDVKTQSFDSNTAGEHILISATVRIPGDSLSYTQMTFTHANVASNVNVLAGSFMWLTRLGSDDLIVAS